MPAATRLAKKAAWALGAYAGALAFIALWPTPIDRPVYAQLVKVLGWLHERGFPEWVDYNFVEFSANVVLFVPFGVFGTMLVGTKSAWVTVVAGAIISLSIELAQSILLPQRFPTLSDVVANTMGTALGALVLAAVLMTSRPDQRE